MVTKGSSFIALFPLLMLHATASDAAEHGVYDPACEWTYEAYVQEPRPLPGGANGARLIGAAAGGDILELSFLVKHGSDPNYSDPEMMTPLAWAARCGRLAAVKFLVENGANVNVSVSYQLNSRFRYRDSSALIWAAQNEHIEVVRYLLAKGANPRRREKVFQLNIHSTGSDEEEFYGYGRTADDATENVEILSLLKVGVGSR